MTIDEMRGIYNDIVDSYPDITMTAPLDDMVRSSFALVKVQLHNGGENWGSLRFDGKIDTWIFNNSSGYQNGIGQSNHDCQPGFLQLVIEFESRLYLSTMVQEDSKLGFHLLPLLSILARHSRPFFGFYYDESDLMLIDEKIGESSLDDIQNLLSSDYSRWGSMYVDSQLAQTIGTEVLDRWATLTSPVDDFGFFLERSGIPLHGSIQEKDYQLAKERDNLFGVSILPKLLDSLRREYYHDH